jgi:hypothetical protein
MFWFADERERRRVHTDLDRRARTVRDLERNCVGVVTKTHAARGSKNRWGDGLRRSRCIADGSRGTLGHPNVMLDRCSESPTQHNQKHKRENTASEWSKSGAGTPRVVYPRRSQRLWVENFKVLGGVIIAVHARQIARSGVILRVVSGGRCLGS